MFVRAVGVNLYTCSVPVDRLSLFVTIFPLKPRGFAAAEPAVSAPASDANGMAPANPPLPACW